MAKHKYRNQPDSATERVADAAGLQVIQPAEDAVQNDVSENHSAEQADTFKPDQDVLAVEDYAEPMVSTTAPNDPSATIAACLIGVGRTYNEMADLSKAISKFLPKVAGEPELHAFLMRVQGVCGDFRHAIDQIEQSMSDRLRDAISQAVSA